MARDGSVGRETFEQVEALLKQGKNKNQAFEQIAAESRKNVGTVAANYYRVARASGSPKPRPPRAKARVASKRKPRATTATPARRRQSGTRPSATGDVDQIAAELVKSVQALADAVRAQGSEVAGLRARLDGVREAIR